MPSRTQHWRDSLITFLLVALALAASYQSLIRDTLSFWWGDDGQSQNLLIFPLVLYLLGRMRKPLRRIRPRLSWGWVCLIPLLLVALEIAGLMFLQSVQITLLLLLLPALAIALFGREFARQAWFPLCFLLLASPFWDYLTPLLQWLSIKFSVLILQLTDLPVYVSGRFVDIPAGQFEIESGCSGMRYFKSALAIGLLYAHLFSGTLVRKAAVVALLIAFALAGNWLRIVSVILIGYYTRMQHPLVTDHAGFGWWIFAALLVLWFWLAGKILRPTTTTLVPATPSASAAPLWRLLLSSTLLLLLLLLFHVLEMRPPANSTTWRSPDLSLPRAAPGWTGPEIMDDQEWRSWFPGAALEKKARYRREDGEVLVYLVIYQAQQQGLELVNETNHVFNPAVWGIVAQHRQPAPAALNSPGEISVAQLGRQQKRLLWSWYDFGNRVAARATTAKLLDMLARLRGDQGTALIGLATDYTEGQRDAAQQRLENFLTAHPQLRDGLRTVLQPAQAN